MSHNCSVWEEREKETDTQKHSDHRQKKSCYTKTEAGKEKTCCNSVRTNFQAFPILKIQNRWANQQLADGLFG